jgi:hypothetical protein
MPYLWPIRLDFGICECQFEDLDQDVLDLGNLRYVWPISPFVTFYFFFCYFFAVVVHLAIMEAVAN